ncbi:SMR family transporter [Chryseobacterium sp.]|uniref:DMT family transporter n=1 Tax=Chryseobacterium sp. TaxID=1871047 RepID=UPI000EDA9308|nr:SMR family transporter [Chryseobacterium sp.]HCA06253.1 QacE family quaternary ammonium compound efflux SMR transporter [Chryseobacterium sp.]
MKYLFLGLAICFEVVGSSFLAKSNGFSKLVPSIITVIAFSACFFLFSQALKSIPLGIAYAIWAGLGIVLTAAVSVVIFKQKLDTPALLGMLLIVAGVVVINVFSKSSGH